MTYSIYFTPEQIKRNLIMDDVRKSDTLNAGMLEQVLENLINWHDIYKKDLSRVCDYIGLEYGHICVEIYKEKYIGSFCELIPVCGIKV